MKNIYRSILIIALVFIPYILLSQDVVETSEYIEISFTDVEAYTESNEDGHIALISNPASARSDSKLFNYEIFHYSFVSDEYEYLIHEISYDGISELGSYDILNKASSFLTDQDLEPYVRIRYQGIKRGVPVKQLLINPFSYNPETGILSKAIGIKVRVYTKEKFQLSGKPLDELDRLFFSNVINIERLSYYINEYDKEQIINEKEKNSLQSFEYESWYDRNDDMVKLITKTDNIAYATANDIIDLNQSFANSNKRNITLLHIGEALPYYLSGSNDRLDRGDTIYFEGSHARGDTSWYDFYTDEEPYILRRSEDKLNDNFIELKDNSRILTEGPSDAMQMIHLEKDSYYHIGAYYFLYPDKVYGEGWFWDDVDYDRSKSFSLPINTAKDINNNDAIEIRIKIGSKTHPDFSQGFTHHTVNIDINGENIKYELGFSEEKEIVREISSVYAISHVNIYLDSLFDEAGNLVKANEVSIDYIEYEGSFEPIKANGLINFSIDAVSEQSIPIRGFGTSKVVAIDRENKTISYLPTERVGLVSAYAENMPDRFMSMMLNDSLMDFRHNGILFGTIEGPDYNSVRFLELAANDPNVEIYLRSMSKDSYVIIAYNSDTELSAESRSLLRDIYGAKRTDQIKPGNLWIMTGQKNNPTIAREYLGSGSVSAETEFTSESFQHHKAYYNPVNGVNDILVNDFEAIEKAKVSVFNRSEMLDDLSGNDLIIVAHSELSSEAERLVSHRENFNGITGVVYTVDEIYDEFSYGKKSIFAIKDLLRYAYFNWEKKPRYLILMGDGCSDPKGLLEETIMKDLVPTYGIPASDHWYTTLEGDDFVSELISGRIPAENQLEAKNYVDKLIQYDEQNIQPWMKRFLFMSGGLDEIERSNFCNFSQSMDPDISGQTIGGEVNIICKKDPQVGGEKEAAEIIDVINSGVIWANYLGHSSPINFDMDGWQIDRLNNIGRYPYITTIGCNASNYILTETKSRSEENILEPNKGFIASSGGSTFNMVQPEQKMVYGLYKALEDTQKRIRAFGDMIEYAKSRMFLGSEFELRSVRLYILLGDPLTRIKISDRPDLYFLRNELEIISNSEPLFDSDSLIQIKATVRNSGFCTTEGVDHMLIHQYEDQYDTLETSTDEICLKKDIYFTINISGKPGKHYFSLIADINENIEEAVESNNRIDIELDVLRKGIQTLEPYIHWNVDKDDLKFRFLNTAEIELNEESLAFYISEDFSSDTLYISEPDEITISETHIDWEPEIELEENGAYYLLSSLQSEDDANELFFSENVPFHISDGIAKEKVLWKQGSAVQAIRNNIEDLNIISDKGKISYRLQDTIRTILLSSAGGNQGQRRYVKMQFDNKIFQENADDASATVGFNIIELEPEEGDFIRYRWFQTFRSDDTSESNPLRQTVRFLKDSVGKNNFLLLATSGAAMNGFYELQSTDPADIGSLDSLRYYLKQVGAEIADSLKAFYLGDDERFPDSYILGVKFNNGEPDNLMESYKMDGDLISDTSNYTFLKYSGRLDLPVVGNARKWLSFSSDMSKADTDSSEIVLDLFSASGYRGDTILSIKIPQNGEVDLSEIDHDKYPFIYPSIEVNRTSKDRIEFGDIEFMYEPVPELGIVNSETGMEYDSTMRGDNNEYSFSYSNISLRSDAEKFTISNSIISNSGVLDDLPISVSSIDHDDKEDIEIDIETKELDLKNTITSIIDPENKLKERFTFNNSDQTSIVVFEDRIKPYIEFTINSKEVSDGDFIPVKSYLDVNIFDNSTLPLGPGSIEMRVNFQYPCEDEPDKCTFESYGEQRPLKANYGLTLNMLDIGNNNIIRMTYQDATGNRDTVQIELYVSQNGAIEDLMLYPNPAIDEVNFSFYYKAPEEGATAEMSIFDLNGREIHANSFPITVGENLINWQVFDSYKRSISPGVYFYRISFISDVFLEPVYGKFVIIE